MKVPRYGFAAVFLFVCSFFLSVSLSAQTVMFVTPETLSVHSGPSSQDMVITELSRGEKVTVTNITGDWAAVTFWGRNGYVLYKYLNGGNTTTTTTPPAVTQPKPATTSPKEATVLICESNSAYAYHSHTCHGLARCTHTISKVTQSEAKRLGYVACKICY